MRKLIGILSLAFLPLQSLLAQIVLPETCSVAFRWQGDSVLNAWEPHAAMLVPIRLAGCPRPFYLQFDLGAPQSILYESKLNAVRSRYPAAAPPIEAGIIRNFTCTLGEAPVSFPSISVKPLGTTGIDWQDTSGYDIIGTLGADAISGRAAVIDYPLQTLALSSAIPGNLLPRLSLANFTFARNRILLPATVNGKETLLFFDTGSSMFELLTDPETARQLALPGSTPRSYAVNSWGKSLTANTSPANGAIGLAGHAIPLRSVSFMEGADPAQVAFMRQLGIGGMTGNKLFLQHILVLDTKRQLFGLIAGD